MAHQIEWPSKLNSSKKRMARQTEWLTIEWLTFFFSYFSVFHFLKIVNIVKIAAKILFLARCKFMITLLRLLKLKENFSHTHTHAHAAIK